MTVQEVLKALESHGSRRNVEGMARFGIVSAKAYGVPAPAIRALGKKIGTDHGLALRLWATGVHEARLVAALIGDPEQVTKALMSQWVKDFDNWGVCDGVCSILFDKTPFAVEMALKWSRREQEFVRRAGYVLMAALAVHKKEAPDDFFLRFLPVIKRGSMDNRNFVKKAVNWALRQIGKRNSKLNAAALNTARIIRSQDSSAARWIASDAIRELESRSVRLRLAKKEKSQENNCTRAFSRPSGRGKRPSTRYGASAPGCRVWVLRHRSI